MRGWFLLYGQAAKLCEHSCKMVSEFEGKQRAPYIVHVEAPHSDSSCDVSRLAYLRFARCNWRRSASPSCLELSGLVGIRSTFPGIDWYVAPKRVGNGRNSTKLLGTVACCGERA